VSIIGHVDVTIRAYAQDKDTLEEAARFAEAAVHNGLGRDHPLTRAQELRLKAQIERDFLVSRLHR
jgi:hypothetical protein